jgi:hypothetical protein
MRIILGPQGEPIEDDEREPSTTTETAALRGPQGEPLLDAEDEDEELEADRDDSITGLLA